jgi:hypothetical protein
MPIPTDAELGPLAPLAGTWEGDKGLDVAFHNAAGGIVETPYRERTVLNPFGPVDNGRQKLFGLDYRMAAWRADEEDPFHTEVGYWLWDAGAAQVMRCFMIPRGSTLLAGGPATPDARTFTMQAEVGSETYGILSNQYLATAARTVLFQVTITVNDDGSWEYDELTTVTHSRMPEPVLHTDRNILHKVPA